MTQKIKIIIAEDHQQYISSLISSLKKFPIIHLVGQALNGIELLDLLKTIEADVLLLDIRMPKMNGYEALAIIRKSFPKLKVIIMSLHYDPYHVSEFFKLGACSYFSKSVDTYKLVEAIEIVHNEGQYIDEDISQLLIQSIDPATVKNSVIHQKALNEIEIEVLKLICKGKRGKEITQTLSFEIGTLNFHKKNIKTKTGCNSDAELVFYAIQHGFVPLTEL